MTNDQMTAVEQHIISSVKPIIDKALRGCCPSTDDWEACISSIFDMEGQFIVAIIDNYAKPHYTGPAKASLPVSETNLEQFNSGVTRQIRYMRNLGYRKVAWPILIEDD